MFKNASARYRSCRYSRERALQSVLEIGGLEWEAPGSSNVDLHGTFPYPILPLCLASEEPLKASPMFGKCRPQIRLILRALVTFFCFCCCSQACILGKTVTLPDREEVLEFHHTRRSRRRIPGTFSFSPMLATQFHSFLLRP